MTPTISGEPFPVARYAANLPEHRRDSFAVYTRKISPEALQDFLRRADQISRKNPKRDTAPDKRGLPPMGRA